MMSNKQGNPVVSYTNKESRRGLIASSTLHNSSPLKSSKRIGAIKAPTVFKNDDLAIVDDGKELNRLG